ncbi:MAG: glycosyltransferase family 2 protein [Alphaproteobacteria bacterium]|nr:glycosyltransferase family 2 protein [Alphaproteobacteria bacterium]
MTPTNAPRINKTTANKPTANKPTISIVVPVKNEAGNVVPLIDEICAALEPYKPFEIVYVDDGSDDTTPAELSEKQNTCPELTVVTHRRSAGQSRAVYNGIKQASAPLVGVLDGDGQNDPADLPALIEAYRAFEAEGGGLVIGHRAKRKDTAWRRFASRTAFRVRFALLGDDTPDTGCGLKVTRRVLYLDLPYFDHMHRFVSTLVVREGFKVKSVPVHHRDRTMGQSKYTVLRRAAVGLVDIFGLMWLKRRARRPGEISVARATGPGMTEPAVDIEKGL